MFMYLAESESPVDAFFDPFVSNWWLWLLVGLAFVGVAFLKVAVRWLGERDLARSGMADIDEFGGKTFEMYLEAMFRRLGYRVERTRFVGDYGGDLVLRKDGVRTIVQAKRQSTSVGVKAVQEAVAAKAMYDCTEATVVTNSNFSAQARTLARRNKVVLWDRDDLQRSLQKVGGRSELAIMKPPALEPPPVVEMAEPLPTVESCATCAKVLTAGERRYCESNARRFGGRMLCYRHQRTGSR